MTKRDLDVLPQKELFRKTSTIVEQALNCRIEILYRNSKVNYCVFMGDDETAPFKGRYKIVIANPAVKGIHQYTALIHELSHVLYESPFKAIRELMSGKISNKRWVNSVLAHNVWNILEDQRIESHLCRYYIAYRKRFNDTLTNLGKIMRTKCDIENPLFVLMAIRFKREDLVKDCKYYKVCKKAINDVENTDRYGALRVLISLAEILNEYSHKRELDIQSSDDNDNLSKKVDDRESELSNYNSFKERDEKFEDDTAVAKIPDILRKLCEKEDKDIHGIQSTEKIIDQILEAGKIEGEIQFQEVRSEMLGDGTGVIDRTPPNVKFITREVDHDPTAKIVPNYKTARAIKKIFGRLKMGRRPFINTSGTDVDVSEYIERYIEGVNLNKCLIDSKKSNGVSVIISVDGSLSMRGYRINTVRNLVATLFESVKDIKGVEIRGNIWSSNGNGEIGITEINSKHDIGYINVRRDYMATPTHMALEYSGQMLKEMKGNKQYVFLITDGAPNYYRNGVRAPRNHYTSVCNRSFKKLLKQTPNIVCILVNSNISERYSLKQLFRNKRTMIFNDMGSASEKVIKEFKRVIMT